MCNMSYQMCILLLVTVLVKSVERQIKTELLLVSSGESAVTETLNDWMQCRYVNTLLL